MDGPNRIMVTTIPKRGAVYKVRHFVYGPWLSLGQWLVSLMSLARSLKIRTPNALPSLRLADNAKSVSPQELTPRQREILVWVAQGYSSKEIAFSLGISGKTVETHRAMLKERLDIHNVAGLVRYALRVGLIS